jgi:hypothetical protein
MLRPEALADIAAFNSGSLLFAAYIQINIHSIARDETIDINNISILSIFTSIIGFKLSTPLKLIYNRKFAFPKNIAIRSFKNTRNWRMSFAIK